jgi:hypothetical protein
MSLLALLVLIVCLYFAVKVVGFALKVGFILLLLAAAYWVVAPMLGWPLP